MFALPSARASALACALACASIVLLLACSAGSESASARDSGSARSAGTLPAHPETPEPKTTGAPTEATPSRVTLAPAAFANAGIEIAAATTQPAGTWSGGLELPAIVALDPSRVAVVSSRAAGRLERVVAVPGQRVRRGETVAYLTSPAFLTAQSDYAQARRRLAVLSGTADEPGARALVRAARDRLALLGASSGTIARLDSGGEPGLTLGVAAPFGGNILETMALAGSAVEPGTPILRIADLSSVDVIAQVPQQSLAAVRPGQAARVTVPAFAVDRFTGRVVRLQDLVDSTTRTVGAVIRVGNSGGRLRPGMFATAHLTITGAAAGAASATGGTMLVVVPESAVVTQEARHYVFVEVGVRTFERRSVVVEPLTPSGSMASTSTRVGLRTGVASGERVVVQGAITLQSELSKGRFGDND